MKGKIIITIAALSAITAIATTALVVPLIAGGKHLEIITIEKPAPQQTRLEKWLTALEWCESKGVGSAINEVDLDGTPSYYWYQFKPETFLGFGKQYGLIASTTTLEEAKDLMRTDYELTRDIARHMAQDPSVDLRRQFPDCINRFVGLPPRQ